MTAKTDAQLPETEAQAPAKPETPGARLAARKAAKAARKAAERGKSAEAVTDAVEQEVIEATDWVADHGRTIVIALSVAAVIGAGVIGYRMMAEQQATEAASDLGKGVKASLAAVGTAADLEGEESEEETYETLDARAEKALAGYRGVVSKHGNTEAALWARLGEGNELLAIGKAEEAERAFAAVVTATDDEFLRYRALEGQGFALEAQNKLDDATQKFAELAKLDNGAYKPASDYHLARLLAVRGDTKGAKDLFGKLLDSLGEQALTKGERFAAIKDEAELRLAELGGERKARPTAGANGMNGIDPAVLEQLRKQLDLKAPAAPEGQ